VRSSGDIRWRCTERRMKCPGVVHTDSNHRNVRQMADHRHPANLAAVEIAHCRVQMKARATSSRDKPGVIYTEALQTLSERARCTMTAGSSVKRTLRNYKTVHHPPQGQSLSELTIDGDWATTGGTDKKPFMVYDNGVDSEARLIVFATDKCLEQLGRSSTWYMDGNFSMAPRLFLRKLGTTIYNIWLATRNRQSGGCSKRCRPIPLRRRRKCFDMLWASCHRRRPRKL